MKVEKLLPEVYYKESRDFSYIGRLLEVVFNYAKTGVDCVGMNFNDENISSTLLTLLTTTIGFELKHEYINKDMVYIASSFSELVRNKGTTAAIETAIQLLLSSQNISSSFKLQVDENDPRYLEIMLPTSMRDIILLEDLFEYILPAGTLYKFTLTDIRDSGIKNTVNISDTSSTSFRSDNDAAKISYRAEDDELVADDRPIDITMVSTGLKTTDPNYEIVSTKPSDWDKHYDNYYIYSYNDTSKLYSFELNTESNWDTLVSNNIYVYKKIIDA